MDLGQQRALVALLDDGDAATVQLVRDALVTQGDENLTEYRTLLEESEGRTRVVLSEVIETIEASANLGNTSRLLASLKTFEDLENLCWELTRAEHYGFDGGPYARQLDSWAEALRTYLTQGATSEERVRVLTQYLANEQRLLGNHTDYYHPRNCFLPWVIEFRQGLPITLTLIYILVGRRLGIQIDGLSAPGHFLASHDGIIFDPYYGGRIVCETDWELIVADMPQPHRDAILQPATPGQVAHRLLLNLRNAFVKRDNPVQQKRIDHLLAVLQR